MKRLALLISSILEPMLVVYIIALIGGRHAALSGAVWSYYVMLLSLIVGLVIGVRLFFKNRDHTNWDISERKKRLVPLFLLVIIFGIASLFVRSLENPVLTAMFTRFFYWHLGFFLCTFRVKLSGHMGIATLAIGQLLVWFGWSMAPILLALPLLAWSRIMLKRHTVKEVIIGVVYSGIIVLLPTL